MLILAQKLSYEMLVAWQAMRRSAPSGVTDLLAVPLQTLEGKTLLSRSCAIPYLFCANLPHPQPWIVEEQG